MEKMIKQNIGPGKGSAWENETREWRRSQKPTCWHEIESEIPRSFLSSSTILRFILSVRRRRRRRIWNHSRLSLCGNGRTRQPNHFPLIASLTPASCRFLTDILQDRWRQSSGGDFCADESEESYQTRKASWCHVGKGRTGLTFPV